LKPAVFAVVCAFAAAVVCTGLPRSAAASPFNDVPQSRATYEALQSLADHGLLPGYRSSSFLAGRRLTRMQTALLIAQAIEKVQSDGGAANADLAQLRRLMTDYKDELGSVGVRLTALEDQFNSLNGSTQFAQRFSLHGIFNSSYSQRENLVNPKLVSGGLARADAAARFTDAFIETDSSNDPYYGSNPPDVLVPRAQWEFTAKYALTPDVLLSLPVNIIDYSAGGYRDKHLGVGINPTLEISVPNVKNLNGLNLRLGQLDNLRSSLTGLTYSPPDNAHPAYKDPYRPFPQGGTVSGSAFNHTDFQLFAYKLDNIGVYTGPFGPDAGSGSNDYLGPYYFPQASNVYGSAPVADTFAATGGPLQSVVLRQNVQPGSAYVSYFVGPGCASGCYFSGPNQPGEPAFNYVQSANQIAFLQPLPPGSTVVISYQGYSVAADTFPRRYDAGARFVYHLPGLPNGSLGLTINRIFDLAGDQTYFKDAALPSSPVSDTVFGMDVNLPLGYTPSGGQTPTLYAELAASKYTADAAHIPASSDGAAVVGLRFKLLGGEHTLAYQDIGPNFMDGAPFRYSGQAPPLFAFWNMPQLPGSFGIANNAALNQQVDAIAAARGIAAPSLALSGAFPYGTFAFPLFNQFKAQGPYFYSSYAPNTRGPSVQLSFPLSSRRVDARLRLGGQALTEAQPSSLATQLFGGGFPTNVRASYEQAGAGVTLGLPLFTRRATVNLDALYERLQRDDKSSYLYAADPALGLAAFNPLASAQLAGSSASVLFYPNYVNVRHYYGSASVAVPITAAVTANFAYTGQAYRGAAMSTLMQSINEKKTAASAGVLYNIPNTNASVNLFFNRYVYKDEALPSYDWVQNRQNLYFTVKF
jgi:hypothetical protein